MRILGASLVLLATAIAHAAADPLPTRARHVADYDIQVTLDVQRKQLSGRQRMVWRNASSDVVPDLWFHLYLNAFRNTRSTFWRESGGAFTSLRDAPDDAWGWIDVTSIRLTGGTDLTRRLRFEAPDDGNVDDRTVARLVLPQPVGPGESVALDVTFTARLPRVVARTGYARDYYLVAQWFPKLGVYEPAGRRGRTTGGWNCHQFHANSEFYADFGRYRVEMTVPGTFVLGATGVRTLRHDNSNGTTTYVHEQDDVHDFAWTVDPRFVEVRRRFDASRDVSAVESRQVAGLLGRSENEVRLSNVELIFLMQPANMSQIERYERAVKLALTWYGLRYGRYPYRTLTVVDPPLDAFESGGMEYPTFVTAGTIPLLDRWPFRGINYPEFVTVHEVGHQFWYGLVANNEFEEAWLDEGINSYATGRALEAGYGRDATLIRLFGWKLNEVQYLRVLNGPDRVFDAIVQPAWTYAPGAYGFNSYMRPELVLRTLEGQLGEQTLARILRTFHERWRFGHPSTADFVHVASEVSGRDLGRLLTQMLQTGDLLDYEVGDVESERVPEDAGYVDGRLLPSGDPEGARSDATPYRTSVMLRRRGDIALPVEVALKFDDHREERFTWDGQARWRRFVFDRPVRLQSVNIDPDRKLELDIDWLDKAYRLESDRLAAASLASRWLFLIQQLVSCLGL
jgi:hypothetical protein